MNNFSILNRSEQATNAANGLTNCLQATTDRPTTVGTPKLTIRD
ncbi:hypothetical protein [Spirosoma aureum]|nr:hypothetical protein [Spirosoma aureum]